MKLKCDKCRGKGFLEKSETCPDCKGAGSTGFSVGVGASNESNCSTCNGKGKLIDKIKCDECDGEGYEMFCGVCGNELDDKDSFLCATCEENPVIIQLAQPLDQKYLNGKRALAATVINVDGRGALVDLGAGFKGTFQPKGTYYKDGQVVPVRLKKPITPKDRGGKAIPVKPLKLDNFKVVKKHLPVDDMTIDEINEEVGNVGRLFVQVTDIFVIRNGPTLFTVIDTNGDKIQATAYGDDNKQAYPSITRNTVVKIIGRFRYYNDQERIQIYSLEKVKASEAMDFMDQLATVNQKDGSKIDEVSFFTESEVYSELKPKFVEAAKKIRSAILRGQNIILRYHSPCVDGTAGAYALDFAIRRFLATRGARRDEFRRALRRLPHRSPIFEVADAARDMSFALDDGGGPQRNVPLYILVDVGSSEDSIAALDFCNTYDVDVLIIDHHALADGIAEKAHTLINPNELSESHMISSGMLATELAKFVSAEQDLEKRIVHLGALAANADKLEGDESEVYLEKAKEYEWDSTKLENIKFALEYVTFGLRHFDGGEVIRNILGVSGQRSRTNELIESITPTAKSLFNKSLKIMSAHAQEEELNGSTVYEVDLENYTPRYDYPPHSELLQQFHLDKVDDSDNPIVTLGISQAYIIIRNSKIDFNFPEFLETLQAKLPDYGITGGGHNSFGSIQFYTGHKEEIIESIKEIITE